MKAHRMSPRSWKWWFIMCCHLAEQTQMHSSEEAGMQSVLAPSSISWIQAPAVAEQCICGDKINIRVSAAAHPVVNHVHCHEVSCVILNCFVSCADYKSSTVGSGRQGIVHLIEITLLQRSKLKIESLDLGAVIYSLIWSLFKEAMLYFHDLNLRWD